MKIALAFVLPLYNIMNEITLHFLLSNSGIPDFTCCLLLSTLPSGVFECHLLLSKPKCILSCSLFCYESLFFIAYLDFLECFNRTVIYRVELKVKINSVFLGRLPRL